MYFNERESTYVEEYDLKKHSIKIQAQRFWARLMELNKALKNEKPDVVYTWGNMESIFILLLNPFHSFKFINGSIRHGIRSNRFSHYFRTMVLHVSSNIVANSYAGLKANNLKRGMVLYNGIAPNFIGQLSAREKDTRKESLFSKASDKLLFISVANLVPYKDYFSILKALKVLKDENIDFHYIILGEGPLRPTITETIKEYKLEENISLLGNVENVPDYLKISDVFIHSSKGEGCSNAILEAMAAGLPIIASDTGGTSEIVTNEVGMLFEYKNHKHLKDSLTSLIADKEKILGYGKNAYNKVAANFTMQRMMNKYYQIIENILK